MEYGRIPAVAGEPQEDVALEPKNPDYHDRTLRYAEAQPFANHLGIEIEKIQPGFIQVEMEPAQFHRNAKHYIQPGIVVTVGQYAASLATLTLLAADEHAEDLEVKVDFVRAPRGDRLVVRARVKDSGRRLSAAEAEIFVAMGPREALIAKLTTLQQVVPGGD